MKLNNAVIIKAVIFFVLGLICGYYFLKFRLILILFLGLIFCFLILDNTKKIYMLVFILLFMSGFLYLNYFESGYRSEKSVARYNGKVVEVIGKVNYKLDSLEGNSVNLKPLLVNNKRVKYGKIQLWKEHMTNNISHGDLIIARMKLEKPQGKRNPGGFSFYKYLKKQRVYSVGNVFEIYKIQSGRNFINIIIKIKSILLNSINNKIPGPVNEFIKALILGEKSGLNTNWESNFRRAGANHLLAISGLHIGFITIFILTLLKPFSIGEFTQNILLGIFLFIYILMTGLRASVLRASFLVMTYRIFKQLNLELEFSGLISIVLFLVLLVNPYQLFSIGLQLSFLVLLMIVSWTEILQKYFHPLLAVSIAAQLGSIPLTAYYFNTVTPAGIITNLWAIPLVSVIVFLVLTHFSFYLLIPSISNITGKLIYLISTLLKKGINIMSDLPAAEIMVFTPSLVNVFLGYLFLFLLAYLIKIKDNIKFRKRYQILKYVSIVVFIIITFVLILPPKSNNLLNIYCLDVGQGDSIFVKTPENKTLLIDTGKATPGGSQVQNTIIPFLLNKRIRTIDYLIISHFDGDHCSKADYLIENGFVKNLVLSKNFDSEYKKTQKIIKKAKEKGIRILTVKEKDLLNLSETKIEFLAPLQDKKRDNRNNNSVVFRLNYKDFEMLFPGDIEKEVETDLIKNIPAQFIKADILKAAHHGSLTSSIDKFIKKVKPSEVLVSVGFNNYGHPSEAVLKRYKKYNSRVWRTDKKGAIIIRSDGFKYSINSYIN